MNERAQWISEPKLTGSVLVMKMMQRIMAKLPGQISCKEFDEKLDDYLEGELSLSGRFRVAIHLVACHACAVYAAAYRKTVAVIKTSIENGNVPAADEPVPEDLVQDIVKKQLDAIGK